MHAYILVSMYHRDIVMCSNFPVKYEIKTLCGKTRNDHNTTHDHNLYRLHNNKLELKTV